MIWYVATLESPTLQFPNREAAVDHIIAVNQDGRARPRFTRIGYRLFEYTPPANKERERITTYYLGDGSSLRRQGFILEEQ